MIMEKINIAELLKDCPMGMELDCMMYDNLYFKCIREHPIYPIVCYTIDSKGEKNEISFNWYGKHTPIDTAKCLIFPKGKTTWDGFQRPWTIQDAKDGDVVSYGDGWTCIFKCIHGIWYSSYCFITSDGEFHTGYEEHEVNTTINGNVHPATKEQCNLFFQKIKEAGYKWNPETKTLEKLIEPKFKVGDRIRNKITNKNFIITYKDNLSYYLDNSHFAIWIEEQDNWELVPNKFDITTLVPFESKVLVRSVDEGLWKPAIYGFSHPNGCYVVGGACWKQCIPYKGNEYLRGTTDACNPFYKTWEE